MLRLVVLSRSRAKQLKLAGIWMEAITHTVAQLPLLLVPFGGKRCWVHPHLLLLLQVLLLLIPPVSDGSRLPVWMRALQQHLRLLLL